MYSTNMYFRVVFVTCLLALVSANPLENGFETRIRIRITGIRITGGRNAKKKEFPHQVSMQYSNTHQHRYGGTILSPIWVVIAAHCVDGNRPKIVIKAGKLNITATEPTEQTVEVERLIIHENFVNTEKRNDIAMLKLVKPLKFNAYVNKIDLPVKGSEPTGRAILSGWGSTSRTLLLSYPYILQAVTLQLMNATTCANDVAIERSPYHVDPNNVCTSAGNAGLSACAADSGSPLIQGKKLVGITTVAFINPCGTARPTIYTKVSYFVDWIHHKMNNH